MYRIDQPQVHVDQDEGCGKAPNRPPETVGAGSVVKTVIVPIDGTPLAERSLSVAASLAALFGADLRLFRASFKLDLRDEVAALRSLADRHGLPCAQVEVSTGRSAAPSVIRTSRRTADTVVVMATRGRSGLAATLLGSVADEILRDLDEPMVLVGPAHEERGDPTSIIVCWDGSLVSACVIPAAASWAKELSLPVRLVHVRRESDPPLRGDAEHLDHVLASQVIAALSVGDRLVEVIEVLGDDAAAEILGILNNAPAALVALATKGRGGLLSSSLGRVSSKIVQGSPHPLLVSHPRL